MTPSLRALLVTLSLAVSVSSEGCPSGWVAFRDSCYYRSTYTIEWETANEICAAIQPAARQPSVHDLVTDAFIAETLLGGDRAWLGLSRVDGVWSWSDGSADDWHYWYCDQPGPTGDACVITNYAGTGKWATYRCIDPHYFLCQVEAENVTATAV
ncbi:lectin BRA-3-like [Amphibalanus amphitrite]|uniref:lectin BRA-3-like n=1 Tax=Amphibalanus amphitrite TaxID=1232801 RepID=UPI001C91D905|nr:lectin BRA-3-like [Amphibalanus amphitrite]XP_043197468.1 lectin BRA-3-like [Amphibalanus amphitrite]